MARRQLLNDVQWAGLLLPPSDEREIIRHYTLSDTLAPLGRLRPTWQALNGGSTPVTGHGRRH